MRFSFVSALLLCARAYAQFSIGPTGSTVLAVERTVGGYDYAPAVMMDGVQRMWWCGSRPTLPADHIFYAESNSLRGPWHAPHSTQAGSFVSVLDPTGNPHDFDGRLTCDPSVVRANGVYYLYYGGNYSDTGLTSIGVMESPDGISWQPITSIGRKPILETHPSRRPATPVYGTGQPSVLFLNGLFYLTHTDSQGLASDGNGGGQYILRSSDPTFYKRVDTLTAGGWVRVQERTPGQAESYTRYAQRTGYTVFSAFSVDWAYSDMFNAFVFANNGTTGQTDIYLYDLLNGGPIRLDASYPGARTALAASVTGRWVDGPALVRTPEGHLAPTLPTPECGAIPVQLMESVVPPGVSCPLIKDSTGKLVEACVLASKIHSLDATIRVHNPFCTSDTWSSVLNGWQMVSAGLPLAVVVDNRRVQFALAGPAFQVSKNAVQVDSNLYHQIPFGASLPAKATVFDADGGRPPAFLLNGNQLWGACTDMVNANGSTVRKLSIADYDKYPRGSRFYCVQ